MGAETAVAPQALSGWAEAPGTNPGPHPDLFALIQAGVEMGDLKLTLRFREVELETKPVRP